MLAAIALIPAPLNATLALGGNFASEQHEQELRALPGWRAVDFRGWLSREGVARLLGDSRAGLVLLHPRTAYYDSLPIKLFEYMAGAVPVVASDFPLWRSIVGESRCGILVDPRDPSAIAEAARWILEHPTEAEIMGQRGRAAVLERYNWNGEYPRLIQMYDRLLSSDKRRTAFAAATSARTSQLEGGQ